LADQASIAAPAAVAPHRLAALGRRIQVIGNSASGKSTLGQGLATALDVPFVELDALNWLPGWIGLNATDPERFERRIRDATAGPAWVVAGSYASFCERVFWPRLDTLIWLDPPLPLTVYRVLRRSWRRSRSQELLWGTNRERFWPQLALWRGEESLLWWVLNRHFPKRRAMLATVTDPRRAQLRVLRLSTAAECRALVPGI